MERLNKLPKIAWLYPYNIFMSHFIGGKTVVISSMYVKLTIK